MTRNERLERVAELRRTLWTTRREVPQRTLDRFVEAQKGVWEIVLPELRVGNKRGHWMWYVFPQLEGLGTSDMSQWFGIRDLDEARAYLVHPVLGPRLIEAMTTVLSHAGRKTAEEIFSSVDAMKLRSCATLFDLVSPNSVFASVLDAFYEGQRCLFTVERLGR